MRGDRKRNRGGTPLLAGILLILGSFVPGPLTSQWIEPPGSAWVDVTVYHQDTRRQYGRDRQREMFPNAGHAVTTSLFLTGAIGVIRGVDLWVQAPVHRLRYDDFAGNRTNVGLGDPRVFLRVGPELLGLGAVPVALRGGVKVPGGEFEVDAEVIPLGEGQRDLELLVEVGRSFYPRPIWAMGWVGYRWREPNRANERDPGDERFWYAAVGGNVGRLGWKGAMEGLSGDPWRIQGIRVPTASREMVQTLVSADWPVGPGRIGAGARLPVQGRNLPAGGSLFLQYFFRLGEG